MLPEDTDLSLLGDAHASNQKRVVTARGSQQRPQKSDGCDKPRGE